MNAYGLHLVIVAGGLGSRLAPMTNHIPKFLVNIGKQTGYVEMIRYWKQYSTFSIPADMAFEDLPQDYDQGSLTVICHSTYAPLVQAYHDLYFKSTPLIIKCVDVANGSAHAILSSCNHLEGKSVLFSWCDVIPVDVLPLSEMSERYSGNNVVFTNYNNTNRYTLARTGGGWADVVPELDPSEQGGVFGLYWINRFHTNAEFKDGQDFVEIISQYGSIREHKLDHIIDFGDTPKLIRTRKLTDEAREFNTIEFVDKYVLKAATNNQGQDIIAKEIAWYETLGSLNTKNYSMPVPKVWAAPSKDSFFMSRVEGVPIWKAWNDFGPKDRLFVLQQVIKGQDDLYRLGLRTVEKAVLLNDVDVEAGDKLRKRYREIEGVIAAFGPVRYVNGQELLEKDPLKTIGRLALELETYYANHQDSKYGFIHGDLQFSNSMVNIETREVTIIDPRGYFGKTVGFGLQDYDIGKLLYALSGYDHFNYDKSFGIHLKDGRLSFEIKQPSHKGIERIIADHFKSIHYGWLAVNFIGLAQYIKNDPVKSVAAHYHGLAIAERWLRSFD